MFQLSTRVFDVLKNSLKFPRETGEAVEMSKPIKGLVEEANLEY